MSSLNIEKVTELPEVYKANSLYILKEGSHVSLHFTDSDGVGIYQLVNPFQEQIDTLTNRVAALEAALNREVVHTFALTNTGDRYDVLELDNIILRFKKTASTTARVDIAAKTGTQTIDFKKLTQYDAVSLDGNTATGFGGDGGNDLVLTTTFITIDTTVFLQSREFSIYNLRINGKWYQLQYFFSGGGERCVAVTKPIKLNNY